MSHLFDIRRPQQAGAQGGPGEEEPDWWVIDPPRLGPLAMLRDLRECWAHDFRGAAWPRRSALLALRVLQNVAYRAGYGGDRLRARLPKIKTPDTGAMERNLAALQRAERLDWARHFWAAVNRGEVKVAPPTSLVLELTNACNLDCVGCGVGSDGVRADRMMPLEALRQWVASVGPGLELIRINGLGEATLHPQLDGCLDILAGLPGGREIITNFTAPMHVYERLLHDRFVVLVSWDGCSKEVFEKIRRRVDFEALRAKLPSLPPAARSAGAPEPVILFTLRPENVAELPGTVDLAAAAGFQRLIVNVYKRNDGVEWVDPHIRAIQAAMESAAERAGRAGLTLALPDHLGPLPVARPEARRSSAAGCSFPWTQAVIRWDGRVTACNMMNPYLYGHIGARTFEQVWQGPEASCFRSQANGSSMHPYCRGCYYLHGERGAAS